MKTRCDECGDRHPTERCQMKAPGTANTYMPVFRRLCAACRKSKDIRGRFRIRHE